MTGLSFAASFSFAEHIDTRSGILDSPFSCSTQLSNIRPRLRGLP
jgi:hypothetical protein